MYSFINYLKALDEQVKMGGKELNLDFLRKAERVTSFNIVTKDFESLVYKKEIQHLFNKHFFPDFDLSKTIDRVDKNALNKLIAQLKTEDSRMFSKLHNYSLKGVGPGEATLFFLINNARLGGGSSAKVDLVVGSEKYEVKAVQVSRDNFAYDFKLGGTVRLDDITQSLVNLLDKNNASGSKTEIKKTVINSLREKRETAPEFNAIEDQYRARAYKYFKDHKVIFINNSRSSKQGNIESVMNVKEKDISIERVTSGTIKPMIKLK
jgi:hypothetical protein